MFGFFKRKKKDKKTVPQDGKTRGFSSSYESAGLDDGLQAALLIEVIDAATDYSHSHSHNYSDSGSYDSGGSSYD